jgi:hypothetical protein
VPDEPHRSDVATVVWSSGTGWVLPDPSAREEYASVAEWSKTAYDAVWDLIYEKAAKQDVARRISQAEDQLSASTSPDVCEFRAHLHEVTVALSSSDPDETIPAALHFADIYEALLGQPRPRRRVP